MRKIRGFIGQLFLLCFCNIIALWELIKLGTALKITAIIALSLYFILFLAIAGGKQDSDRKLNRIAKGTFLTGSANVLLCLETAAMIAIAVFGGLSVWRNIANDIFAMFFCAVIGFFGVIRIAVSARQVKFYWYIILLFTWYIPIVNIVVLSKIRRIARNEFRFEQAKQDLDNMRKENEICKTRYPILMVHGIFFRDWQLFNYWGRIPKELVRNGAEIYYGNQQSANTVEASATELKNRILEVIKETGAEKVNIIAHSKGGLDSRYAISRLGMDKYVASLTTINTPHYGCKFVDNILSKVSDGLFDFVDRKYNKLFTVMGDTAPSFRKGVRELTFASCEKFNAETPNAEGVYYHAVMSQMNSAKSAGFPLNIGYMLNKSHGSGNDGLVTMESGLWGENPLKIEHKGKRGISHGDMIDLFRENIEGFDVREFFVDIVKDLKEKGF